MINFAHDCMYIRSDIARLYHGFCQYRDVVYDRHRLRADISADMSADKVGRLESAKISRLPTFCNVIFPYKLCQKPYNYPENIVKYEIYTL